MNSGRSFGIISITILGFLARLIPFLYGSIPLGYDTGFYRRYLTEGAHLFHHVPGLGNGSLIPKMVLSIGESLHVGTNTTLYAALLLPSVILPILIYMTVRRISSERVALVAALLIAVSPIQYFAYWAMLLKSAYGIIFLVLTMYWMERQSSLVYLGAFLIACSHETTSVIFIITLLAWTVLSKDRRREGVRLAVISGSLFLFFHSASVAEAVTSLPKASFISWLQYVAYSFPTLLLAIAGARSFWNATRDSFLRAFALVVIAYPILHLPFYERVFIYTDITVAILAALGVTYFFDAAQTAGTKLLASFFRILAVLLLIGAGIFFLNRIYYSRPLLANHVYPELTKLDSQVPAGSYLLTTTSLAPWTEGWSHAHIVAPGMLYDRHTLAAWNEYLESSSSETKTRFLHDFGRPLYLFVLPGTIDSYAPQSCREQLGIFLFKYTCE